LSLLYQETFPVRFFESEPTGRATPAAVCRFAQEAAEGHCRTLGLSLLDMRAQNRMWVLTHFRLQMDRYPQVGQKVTVETWASSRTNGIRAIRDFCFVDAEGKPMGRGSSIWLLLDAASKRPVRLPKAIWDICNPERSDPEEFELPRLRPPLRPSAPKFFNVGWKELDSNNHTNNVHYIEWALEALPLEIRRDRMLAQLDIVFLAEAFYGDRISSEVEICDAMSTHQLKNQAGTLLALLLTRTV
jgi:acyl-ACP thioesterase